MFPKYGGTKAALPAFLSAHPMLGDFIGTCALSTENIYGQEKLCPKNSKNDCRGGQIERRSGTESRGQGRNGRCDRCRRSRRRSGHEVAKPSRKYRPRTKNGGKKAGAQDKAKSNTQDAAKEKTLGRIDYLIRPLLGRFRSEREPPLVTREPRQIDYSVGFQT